MADNAGYVNEEVSAEEHRKPAEPEVSTHYENEVRVDVPPVPSIAYAGMPKEVLLQYSRQKGYAWARDILTAIVVFTVLVLLALVIAIIAISPPCLEFWQTSAIYQIYPKSFRRSNNENGYGDIKGIIEKLNYFGDELGINVISVNSMYQQSSRLENDYEISDFKNIDPVFGTMTDMQNLIAAVHNRNMKIVVDFVPNHSSDQHPWFIASSNTSHPQHAKYRDYYVWVNGSKSMVPNNWGIDATGNGSSWTWNDNRQQFYYHAFASTQPDLNLRSAEVRRELEDVLRFWLQKGVDGFRSIAASYMLEASHLRHNPTVGSEKPFPDYTRHYKGNHDIISDWRRVLNEYSTEPGVFRFLETRDEGDLATTLRYYGTNSSLEASFPSNLIQTSSETWTAKTIANTIMSWMTNMPKGKWPNWAVGDQDHSRLATRTGQKVALCAAILTMTLPGTPTIYYGDEIGMTDSAAALPNNTRSPMQWNANANAGFCGNCTPWNEVNTMYSQGVNVQAETADGNSILSQYKSLITLRNGLVFQRGYLCLLGDINGVLGYVRELSGLRSMLILLNFENNTSPTLDLSTKHSSLSGSAVIEFSSAAEPSMARGNNINMNGIAIPPLSGLVASYDDRDNFLNKAPTMVGKCFVNLNVCYNSGLQVIQYC